MTKKAIEKMIEGLKKALEILNDASNADESMKVGKVIEAMQILVTETAMRLTAEGKGERVLYIFGQNYLSAQYLFYFKPLITGINLYLDKEVRAAVEIYEVGKDVVKRIREYK